MINFFSLKLIFVKFWFVVCFFNVFRFLDFRNICKFYKDVYILLNIEYFIGILFLFKVYVICRFRWNISDIFFLRFVLIVIEYV